LILIKFKGRRRRHPGIVLTGTHPGGVGRSRRRCGDERRIKQLAGEIVELGASSPPSKLPPIVKPKAHTCSSEETGQTADRPHGSSVTGLTDAERIAARDSALMRLSEKKTKRSPSISQANTTHGPKADVIQMKR
jgi:hypothetical protein